MFLLADQPVFLSQEIDVKPPVEIVAPAWEGKHEFFADFAYAAIAATGNLQVFVGPGVFFNSAYPWNWMMAVNGLSYIEIRPNLTEEQAAKRWNLGLSHLSSLPGGSPIEIEVNGQVLDAHFLPQVDAWRDDSFSLALKEGENVIRIRLLEDAQTHYWIQKLYLDPV